MRKTALIALFLTISFYASSQSNYNFTVGYTLSTLVDDEGRTFESEDLRGRLYSLSSPYLGFSAEKPTNSPLSFRFELNYTAAGGILQADIRNIGVYFVSRVEFHQLQIPMVVKYALSQKFQAYAGSYLGAQFFTKYRFLFYSRPVYMGQPFDPRVDKKTLRKELSRETNDRMHPVSIGVFGGVDYKLSRRFDFTARYNYAFTNMSKERDTGLRMHFLQTGLSYRLNRTEVLKKNEL